MEIVALGSKIAFLSLFTACLLLPSIQCREIKYCNKKADYVVKVHDVVISPDPVKTGEATTFTIKASTKNEALLPEQSWVLPGQINARFSGYRDSLLENPKTNQALTGGKLALDVSYFGIKVHSETHNICEKTSCPISVGKFVLSHTQTLPGITPPELYQHSLAYHTFSGSEFVCTSRTNRATFRMIGSYTLKLRIEDEKKHQLTCASFSFDIGFGSSAFAIAYTFLR